jgi:hypothetical protein
MNPLLKDFFNEEKKRVFTPDSYFSARVMARLREIQMREYNIWDVIPGATRPVLGLALVVMLMFIAVQLFIPQMPDQGFVTAALEVERSQTDAPYLYSGTEIPADNDVLSQLMGLEERQ